jgi:hypothetical protein
MSSDRWFVSKRKVSRHQLPQHPQEIAQLAAVPKNQTQLSIGILKPKCFKMPANAGFGA